MERTNSRRREIQRKRIRQRLMIVSVFMLLLGFALGWFMGSRGKEPAEETVNTDVSEEQQTEKEEQQEPEDIPQEIPDEKSETEPAELPWNLVLVNPWNEMEEGYVPELTEVEENQYVDSRIAEAAAAMLEGAKAEGHSVFICSGYRSVERQEQLFNNKIQQQVNAGLGYYDAYVSAATVVAVPGTSEHALGLAVDIVSVEYTNLDEGQEDTPAFQWLAEHCYEYGFILRYPNGTTDITGIIYEPWHYRYVGVEAAMEIKELGVTLEEYLENHYNQ